MVQRIKTGMIADGAVTTAKMNEEVENLFSFRNRVINGDMRINQRFSDATTSYSGVANAYNLDRWRGNANGGGVFTVQRSSVAPDGFSNSLLATVTTADSSVGGSDFYHIRQSIEGFNFSDFAFGTASAKTVTVSFWVRSSVTGTYTVLLRNEAGNRGYLSTYTINSANTWEYKSVVIPGDTTGTWPTDNNSAAILSFPLGNGGIKTLNSWSSDVTEGATGLTQWISNNGATWYITGVQLEVGSTPTPFERRPYGLELALCQRYFTAFVADGGIDNYAPLAIGRWYEGTSAQFFFTMPTQMRYPPTLDAVSTTAVGTFAVNTGGTFSAGVVTGMSLNERSYSTATVSIGYSTGGQTAGQATTLYCDNTDFARISFTAEL
jgi:hypothetical protein